MKKYSRPRAEFIELSNSHIVMSDCNPYYCPSMYGQGCSKHCYSNTVIDPDCPDDYFVEPEGFDDVVNVF